MVKTKVGQQKNSQYQTTIPKTLADAKGWRKGDDLEWTLEGSNVVIRKV